MAKNDIVSGMEKAMGAHADALHGRSTATKKPSPRPSMSVMPETSQVHAQRGSGKMPIGSKSAKNAPYKA